MEKTLYLELLKATLPQLKKAQESIPKAWNLIIQYRILNCIILPSAIWTAKELLSGYIQAKFL